MMRLRLMVYLVCVGVLASMLRIEAQLDPGIGGVTWSSVTRLHVETSIS